MLDLIRHSARNLYYLLIGKSPFVNFVLGYLDITTINGLFFKVTYFFYFWALLMENYFHYDLPIFRLLEISLIVVASGSFELVYSDLPDVQIPHDFRHLPWTNFFLQSIGSILTLSQSRTNLDESTHSLTKLII